MGSWGLGAFRNQAGLAEQPETAAVRDRVVPVPRGRRRSRSTDRRLRRRRRVHRRQGRPTGDGRLPRLPHQRREPADVGNRERDPGEHRGHRRHHRDPGRRWPGDADSSRRADQRDVHAAVPRPVLHGRSRCPGQTTRRRCSSPVRRRPRMPQPRSRQPEADRRRDRRDGWEALTSHLRDSDAVTTSSPFHPRRLLRHLRPPAERRRGKRQPDHPWHLLAGHRRLPASGDRPLPHVRRLSDRPEHPLQPVRLERARTAHRLRRHRQLPPRLLRSPVPRRSPAQRDRHRPVAAAADPLRPRPGPAAQRQAPRAGATAHDVLRPVHPVRGRHRRRVAPDPATQRAARPGPHGDRRRGADPRVARQPRHRPLQPVLRDRGSTSAST